MSEPDIDGALVGGASLNAESFAGIVENSDLPSGFGHGTMVAGLVRLAAPGAQIMPIRAFDGDGTASVFDIAENSVRVAIVRLRARGRGYRHFDYSLMRFDG